MEMPYESETGCCPRFDPEPWDGTEHTWEDRMFIKDRIRCIFYFPLNFGKVMTRCMNKIDAARAYPEKPFMLTDCCSPWGWDTFIEVSKEVPDGEMVKISGDFITKSFEGPYKDAGKWAKEMARFVKSKGKEMKKLYYFYTTCPSCAKHYGENYTVLVAQV